MDWNGYAASAQFIEGTELMYNLMVEHKTPKVFANIKDMTLIGREDQNYVIYSFLPRAIQAGFRAIAIVKPVSYFNAVAIETMGVSRKRDSSSNESFRQPPAGSHVAERSKNIGEINMTAMTIDWHLFMRLSFVT
jgi:hypothetical protein